MQIDNQIASRRRRSGRANSNHIPDGTAPQTDNPQPPQYALLWIAFAAVVLVLLAAWHGWS
jgi:cytochrome oxidase assembly protein ShyY1